MHDLVDVDAAAIRHLTVVAVSAGVEQHPVLLVLLGVQHVVALLAEPDPNKARAFCHSKCLVKMLFWKRIFQFFSANISQRSVRFHDGIVKMYKTVMFSSVISQPAPAKSAALSIFQ